MAEQKVESSKDRRVEQNLGFKCFLAACAEIEDKESKPKESITKKDLIRWAGRKFAELLENYDMIGSQKAMMEMAKQVEDWETKAAHMADQYLRQPYQDDNLGKYIEAELLDLPLKLQVFSQNFQNGEQLFMHKLLLKLGTFVKKGNNVQKEKFTRALTNILLAVVYALF